MFYHIFDKNLNSNTIFNLVLLHLTLMINDGLICKLLIVKTLFRIYWSILLNSKQYYHIFIKKLNT